jgi:hypothetical protein
MQTQGVLVVTLRQITEQYRVPIYVKVLDKLLVFTIVSVGDICCEVHFGSSFTTKMVLDSLNSYDIVENVKLVPIE